MDFVFWFQAIIGIVLIIVGGILWFVYRKNETRKKVATAGIICLVVGIANILVQLIRQL